MRDFVSIVMVRDALSYVRRAYADGEFHELVGPKLSCRGAIRRHTTAQRSKDIMDVFFTSRVVDVCEAFLGKGNVLIRENKAEIDYNRPVHGHSGSRGRGERGQQWRDWCIRPYVTAFAHAESDCVMQVYFTLSGQEGNSEDSVADSRVA